jgi:hypothetical protein
LKINILFVGGIGTPLRNNILDLKKLVSSKNMEEAETIFNEIISLLKTLKKAQTRPFCHY